MVLQIIQERQCFFRGMTVLNFTTILKKQLEKKEISLNSLCEGLCSESMLFYFCKGERTASKLLQDRLLDRLHVSDIRSENFLFEDEYRKWKLRRQIVKRVNIGAFEEAETYLQEYQDQLTFKDNLEQQFCLVMRIQMLPEGERGSYWEQALKLTVPNIDKKPLSELILSDTELDMYLEYIRCCHFERLSEVCEEMTDYIRKRIPDIDMRARIFPKTVYYQCLAAKKQEQQDYIKLLKNCNEALEYLRTAERLYYFWELLKEREALYEHFIKQGKGAETFAKMKLENELWRHTIEEVYAMCDMQPDMKNSCYLYFSQNTFCINELMRKRRQMLGMTKKELAGDICSEKTIARTEKGSRMQIAIASKILDRLGLSAEYRRVDVITPNIEVLVLVREIADASNDRDYEKVEELLKTLEGLIPMDEPVNRQYVKRTKVITLFREGKISKEQAIQGLKDALGYTMSMESIQESDEVCLTSEETSCLLNMAATLGNHQINEYHRLIWKIAQKYEEEDTVNENISMYEFIMGHIASTLGNVKQYEASNEISKRIIQENLRLYRLGGVADALYNLSYNYRDQNSPHYKEEVWRSMVTRGMVFFRIMKHYNTEKLLKGELKNNQLYREPDDVI